MEVFCIRSKVILSIIVGMLGLVLFASGVTALSAATEGSSILLVELADIVHPISAEYLAEGITLAKTNNSVAVIVRLDTPGGLVDSMRKMVEDILASEIPVIVWVGPSGVRAASAGFFILLSADLALMAPGTNTGAAHPVSSFGNEIDEVMEQKIVNDAAAFIRSYAAQRGRNSERAEKAVTESEAFTADEALQNGLIDAVVNDIGELIEKFDDYDVKRFDGSIERLELKDAQIELFEMTSRQKLLSAIMNPNIALILGLLGLVGLYLEITNPGMIFPGVIGGISLILALFAFNLLPINFTGVLLIVLAICLFVVEATVASHGILAMGGIVAMVSGGLMLVDGPIPQLRIQLSTVLAVAIPLALITVFLVRLVFLSHREKAATGRSGMLGSAGTTSTKVFEKGKVFVHGEYWMAYSKTPIPKGSKIHVVQVDGLKLEVETESEGQK